MSSQSYDIAIPTTKLRPPQPSNDLLNRPTLLDKLYRAAIDKRLTLLSAPAGAGKTSAVVAMHAAHPDLPLAWAALDEGDDDPATFLQLLIAAVQRVRPDFGRTVLDILDAASREIPNFLRLTAVLINDLAAHDDTLIIVLDDLHRVSDATIYRLLDYLLERLPPNVHLVVTTRHDPPLRLAQLRARGQMAEFRLDTLRFAPKEIRALFRDVFNLSVSSDDLALIEARTEGWAAGLQLVTLSLVGQNSAEKRSASLQQLAASQRFLFDYLVEEVLDHLQSAERDFLLQNAILNELTPTVCGAVTGRRDAADLLDNLYRRNLFLTVAEQSDPLAEPTYRYHALFAQFLRQRLQRRPATDIAALHRRAAAAVPGVERQIHHLLAAEAWDEAATLLIDIGKTQCNRVFVRPRLIGWIEQLPETVQANHYWFDLIKMTYLEQQGRFTEAEALARAAYPRAVAADDVAGQLIALWLLANWSPGWREPQWGERFQALVAAHPEAVSAERRLFMLLGRVWNAINQYDYAAAADPIRAYYQAVLASDSAQVYHSTGQHIGPQWFFVDDGMALAARIDDVIMQRVGAGDGVPQAGVMARRAWRHLLRGELGEAERLAIRAGDIAAAFGGFAFLDSVAAWVRAIVLLARRQYDALAALVQAIEASVGQSDTRQGNLAYFWMAQWRAHWLQDEIAAAAALRDRIDAAFQEASSRTKFCLLPLLDGWLAHADGRSADAEQALREAVRRFRSAPFVGTWGHPQIDLALFFLLEGQQQAALATWREVASDLQRRHMPGQPLISGRKVIPLLELALRKDVYADVAQVSLNAFGVSAETQPLPIPGSDETLTPREVDVLQLLMTGATNREIGEQLFITTRTAKAHVSNILAKLGVSSRTEAVARAHALNLL